MQYHSFPDPEGENAVIQFLTEDITFDLADKPLIEKWLRRIIEQEEQRLGLLNFIFCSDIYLHKLNVTYLNHDTLTDVITFPYAEPPHVEGDVFISVDRVRENAVQYEVSFEQELLRVMVHGLFHLCGYGDKAPEEIKTMRKKEDEAILLLDSLK